jgi:hypothetical protein
MLTFQGPTCTIAPSAGINAVYEWSCSNLDSNNSYSLPDLEILNDQQNVFNNRHSIVPTFRDELLVFPLPSTLNCGGTVSAVRYCYSSFDFELGSEKLIFTLLTLEQNGQNFIIRNVINATSTPTVDICTEQDMDFEQRYCCDTLQLDAANKFNLPTPNFAFGIIGRADQLGLGDLFTFDNNSPYEVEHYRPSSADVAVGNTISVGSLSTDRQLTLSKFIISKFVV